jgi:hypothetical protein
MLMQQARSILSHLSVSILELISRGANLMPQRYRQNRVRASIAGSPIQIFSLGEKKWILQSFPQAPD